MSKSLNRCILAVVCIALVCALGLSLLFIGGETTVVAPQEGQAASTAKNTNTYTHGSNIGRALPSDYTSVSDGTQLKAAIEANNKHIVLTNDVTLQTINAFEANNYLWNDNSQCFDSDGNGNTNLKVTGFNYKIYGQGYTIEVQGPHAATGEGMQQNSADTNDYGGLFPKLGNNGAVYDAKIYITKGFSGQTQETWSGAFGSGNDEWLNVGGIAGSLIGNAVIDNVTVEIASGVKLASYKWSNGSSTSQYVRVGAIAGEINNTASISNVTVINNGRLESGQYTSEAKFSPDSDRYYGAAGNVVGWISNATSSIHNVRVEGSGTLYSYYVANIANATGSTVSVNNFYNNFTGTFDAKDKYSNTLGQGEGATSTLTVTNHYKKGALASTAGTDNTVGATNTLTVPNNLTLYFIPNATQDSNRLGIAFSGTTYSSANDYTVTGLNNAEKTASGGFSAAPSGGTLALGLPVGANNWKTDGTFASITATPKFDPSSYAALTKYEHGYVSSRTTNSGTPITSDNFSTYFAPGGQANNSSSTYYLTNDIVVTGFTGINFSGTFDGNGHTIFIVANNTTSGSAVGGLVGNMTGGTIKNLRVVIYNSVNVGVNNPSSVAKTQNAVGGLVGKMSGGSLQNVQVVIQSGATMQTSASNDNHVSIGGVVGQITSTVSLTDVTLQLDGTISASGRYVFTGGIVGSINGSAAPKFTNIIMRGNGTFASTASEGEDPYYAAVGILENSSGADAATATLDGFIYDANPNFTGNYGMYGIFTNNFYNNGNDSNIGNYHAYVDYENIFYMDGSGSILDKDNTKHQGGNAIVPIGDDTTVKNISANVTGVDGSTVKAYFMPGTAASPNLTLVAAEPSSGWSDVDRLQLNDQSNLYSTNDGTNKVVNVAKSTAESMSGENLTLSPYNPYTLISASLENATVTYSGSPYVAQVKFTLADGSSTPVTIDTNSYTITYGTDGAKGETNAGSNYQVTIKLNSSIADNDNSGKTYAFDINGGLSTTLYYEITKKTVSLASNLATTLGGTFGDLQYTENDNSTFTPVISEDVNLFVDTDGNPVTIITAADYRVFAMCGNSFPTTASGLIPAGTYSYNVQFTSAGSNNYQFSSGYGVEGISSVTVAPYALTGTWTLSGLEITYGDPIPDYDQYIRIELSNEGTIPGGLTGVTANGFTADYVQGTTQAGETVTITAGTFTVGSGFTASNYNFSGISGITGGGTVEVQKREITISAADIEDPAVGHIVAIYGGTNYVTSQADLQNLLTWANVSDYVENVYVTDEIGFTITKVAHEQTGEEATYAPGEPVQADEWAKLPANDTYYITVTSANNNYTVAADNYFKYQVKPAELSIDSVTFDNGAESTITYDGQDHNYTVNTTGLVEGDNLEDVINVSVTYNSASHSGAMVKAGTYTVTVELKQEGGNYDLQTDVSNTYTLTISPITFTVQNASADFTQYTDSNEAAKVLEAMIVAGDTLPDGELSTVVSGQILNPEHSGGYLAFKRGGYTVNFAIKTGYATNYAIAGAASATLTINSYDLVNATIEVNPDSNTYTYNGKTQTVPVTVTTAEGANIVDFVTISGNKQTNAGVNYQVTVSGNSSNIAGEQRTAGTWSIAKATITIEGTDALTSEYSGEAVDPADLLSNTYITVSGAASGEDVYSMLTATSADGEILNYKEGGYTVNIALDEMNEGASNYEISGTASVTYTVTKKAVTVTWTAEDIVFGSADAPAAKITDFGGILEKDQNCTLRTTDTYESTMAVGIEVTYTVSTLSWDNEDIQNNYDITYAPANTITVHVVSPEVEIDLTDDSTTFTYISGYTTVDEFLSKFTIVNSGGTPTSANYGVTITDSNSQPVTLSGKRLDVGTYTVTITSTQYQPTGNTTYTYEVEPYDLSLGLTVTVNDDNLVYTGGTLSPIVTVMVDGEDITDLLVIGGNTATDVSATGYTVTVSVGSNANFTGTPSFDGTWNIAPKPITIAGVEGALTSVYDGAEIAVSTLIAENYITVDGAEASFTYSMLTATVQDGATVQNADNYTIIITLNAEAQGSGNYTIEGGSATVTYTVTPATLTVAANEDATLSRAYDGTTTEANSFLTADFLTVTGNVPSDNIYAMLNAAVADDKTIRDAGVYTVTITFNAQEVGASNYNGADINVSLTYTVNRKVITVAFDGYTDLTYNGEAHQITATVQGFVNDEATDITDLVVISGDSATEGEAINAGSYTATVSKTAVEGAYANYTLASDATQEFTIAQATLTLTEKEGATLSRAYDGNTTEANSFLTADFLTVTGNAPSDNIYAMLTATVADGKTIKNADTYTITFALTNADGNYTLTAPVSLTYTVNPKTLTADSVVWTDPDYTYSGSAIAPTAAWAEGAIVTGDSVDIEVTISAKDGSEITNNEAIHAGSYTAAATIAAGDASGNYKLVADVTRDFTIARKAVTITWTDGASDNFTYTYDGTAKAPTASVTEGAVDPDTFADINDWATIDGALTDDQAINAGSYTATITKVAFEAQYDNYTIAEDSEREFVINPQPVTVTMTMKDSESTDVTSPLTWNVSSAIVVERAENVWTLTSGDVSYTVTVTGFESVVGFNSSKLELHLDNEEYTGTPYGTPVTDGVLGIVSADPNYEISMSNDAIILNVVPSLAIELAEGAEISVVYGFNKSYNAAADTNNAFAQYFTVQTSDGSVAPAGTWSYTVVGENQAQTIQDVGTYTIEATYIVTDGGATLKNSIKFSITAAQVSDVTLGTITYGELSATGTITATITYADGTSVDAELSYTAKDITAGDGKTITLGAYTNENANYAGFERRDVTVTIAPAPVTVEVTPEYPSYRGVEIALFGTITDGVFGTDEVSVGVITTNNPVRDAGTYTITGITLTGAAASNYTVGSFTKSITIDKHEVTITVTPNVTTTTPTYTGSKIGLAISVSKWMGVPNNVYVTVNGENAQVADFGVVNAGTYTVGIGGSDANNYVMSAASTSSFTIAKAEATLSIANYATINGQEYNGQPVTITPEMTVGDASLPTGGIVEVSINDKTDYPGTATDQILYAGEYTVTLTVYGDNNIEDTSVYFTVTIAQKAVKVITDDASAYSYDGTAKDLKERVAEKAGVIGNDVVTATVDSIVDESGTTVTELKNAGTYTVTFGLSGDNARNYVIEEEDSSMTVTINPATVTVTVTPASTTYTGSNITVNGTINGKVEGDEVSATITTTVRNAGTYTITAEDIALTGAAAANYTVGSFTESITIAPATATLNEELLEGLVATYGDIIASDGVLTDGFSETVFVTAGDTELEVTITITPVTREPLAQGAIYVGAGSYILTVEIEDTNYAFEEGVVNTVALTVQAKPLDLSVTIPDTTYSSTGVAVNLNDFAEQIVGDDSVDVTIYVTDASGKQIEYTNNTVLNAGTYTVSYEVDSANYAVSVPEEPVTITIAPQAVQAPDRVIVGGSTTVEKNEETGQLELDIAAGEAVNLEQTINNVLSSNHGTTNNDYTITVTDKDGNAVEGADISNLGTLTEGEYTVSVEMSNSNYSGGMTFVVTVSSGSILTPENPPAGLPETPLGGVAEADGNDWLFPVLVAVVALIDICLLAAICIVAKIKRDRNKA